MAGRDTATSASSVLRGDWQLFQRIVRFQRLLHFARNLAPDSEPLAVLAVEAGYAEQAHMTREFQQIAHGTPAALLFHTSSALAMSDLFRT